MTFRLGYNEERFSIEIEISEIRHMDERAIKEFEKQIADLVELIKRKAVSERKRIDAMSEPIL